MLVKEEDAKRYFCAVVSGAQQHIVCKGSHCMAWRWSGDAVDPAVQTDPLRLSGHYGYCGLAGVITMAPAVPGDPL